MEWFRFYNGAINDRKVQQLPAELFKAWVNILCLASATNKGGELPALEDMAFALRMGDEQVTEVLAALEKAGLIDRDEAGNLAPHNWHGRQRKSDDVAERVRHHREGKRSKGGNGPRNTPPTGGGNKGGNNPCNVTGNGSGNGAVTPHAGAHAGEREQIQRDTERERDAHARQLAAEDDPIPAVPMVSPIRPDGSIGTNDPASVRRALDTAEQVDITGTMSIWVPQWLAKHPADFVIECSLASKGKGQPHTYAASIVRKGPQAVRFGKPAPPPPRDIKPWVPPKIDASMFELTPEQEAALARRERAG